MNFKNSFLLFYFSHRLVQIFLKLGYSLYQYPPAASTWGNEMTSDPHPQVIHCLTYDLWLMFDIIHQCVIWSCHYKNPVITRMAFYILFVFAFSTFFDTSNADSHARIPKITMCVLEESAAIQRNSHPAYAQMEIITCQPHEVCSPISQNVNIGKYGLG